MIDDRDRTTPVATPHSTHRDSPPRWRFVGFGSSHGDDRVGWTVADRLEAELPDSRSIHRATIPADLFDLLDDCDRLLLCDACRGGDPPGTAKARTWPMTGTLPLQSNGTHMFGLIDVLRMAEALGRLPREVILWTIEGRDFEPCSPLSAPGRAAAMDVAERILREEFGIADRRSDAMSEADHA